MSLGVVHSRPNSFCFRTTTAQKQERKLKFLPNRPQTAPPKSRPPEPRLLTTLKDAYLEWQERGNCAHSNIEKLIKYLAKKQNNLKYDVLKRDDAAVVWRARTCPDINWGKRVVLTGDMDKTYRQHITAILCPLDILCPERQILKTHMKRQYLVREDDKKQSVIDSTVMIKQLTSLVKLAVPNALVFRASSYIEVTALDGHSVHLYPVVAMKTTRITNSLLPPVGTPNLHDLQKEWLMASCSGRTWEPFSRTSIIGISVSESFHNTVSLVSELRMLHRLHLNLEDIVALVTTAISEHVTETQYRGTIPLHHCFSLAMRLLLHTMQSTRLIRHPATGDIMLRKLAFGRSLKRDAYVKDIIKTCVMFSNMEKSEEFMGLYPPCQLGGFEVPTGLESDEDTISDNGEHVPGDQEISSEESSVVSEVSISD